MSIAKKIEASFERTSWIRKMFEEGTKLKAIHGAKNVFDFSIGNPYLEPPRRFKQALINAANDQSEKLHGYMSNAGLQYVRERVASELTKEQNVKLTHDEILMTCGAAGGLNVIFKAILDPEDEVICPSPFFVEYGFYVDNHGGILKPVPTKSDFHLDIDAIQKAINPKTKALLINSPNNPSGQVYPLKSLELLAQVLSDAAKKFDKIIYLISDEPYRQIVYDNISVPSILSIYNESIVCSSYSKNLSIPGERIGYIALNPNATYKKALFNAMSLTNRILGFVNASAIIQRVVGEIQGVAVDATIYKRKRDLLCQGLKECGYDITPPPGAFYLFPKTPISDDVAFVKSLQEENILTVPGVGFGRQGHVRICYCVDDETITNAMPGFKRVRAKYA